MRPLHSPLTSFCWHEGDTFATILRALHRPAAWKWLRAIYLGTVVPGATKWCQGGTVRPPIEHLCCPPIIVPLFYMQLLCMTAQISPIHLDVIPRTTYKIGQPRAMCQSPHYQCGSMAVNFPAVTLPIMSSNDDSEVFYGLFIALSNWRNRLAVKHQKSLCLQICSLLCGIQLNFTFPAGTLHSAAQFREPFLPIVLHTNAELDLLLCIFPEI